MSAFKIAVVSLSVELLSVDVFQKKVEALVLEAKANNSELILFPEYCFSSIIAVADDDVVKASEIVEKILFFLSHKYCIAICGCGIYRANNLLYNQAYYIDDEKITYQQKINLIESEKIFGLCHGLSLKIINTKSFKLAILICYDIEFPELTRILVENEVSLLLVPSYTVDNFGANRVEFCARARAIENHIYVAKSCLIGNQGHSTESPQGRGISALYSPCDLPFNEHGIVASAISELKDCVCYGEVNLTYLESLRDTASTKPFNDYLALENRNISVENVFLV